MCRPQRQWSLDEKEPRARELEKKDRERKKKWPERGELFYTVGDDEEDDCIEANHPAPTSPELAFVVVSSELVFIRIRSGFVLTDRLIVTRPISIASSAAAEI